MKLTSDFKQLLGSESRGEWIKFMDLVAIELPFLAGRGKPPADSVKNSIIGASGCDSWREYVTKELNWSYGSWSAWSKAYKIVLIHSYLRDLSLTASAINTRAAAPGDFPATAEAWATAKTAANAAVESNRAEYITQMRATISNHADEMSERDTLTRLSAAELTRALNDLSTARESLNTERARTEAAQAELLSLRARIESFNSGSWLKRAFATL